MARLVTTLAGLLFGFLLATPASANTIATFSLTAFFNGGGAATGTFSLDVTAHTIENVSITTTTGTIVQGASYPGFAVDTYTLPFFTRLDFYTSATALPPLGGQQLSLFLPLDDSTDLSSLPTFIVSGRESVYFFLCGGLCADRSMIGGLKTLSVVATTPLPATLPLLATALGGGAMGWRRKRQSSRLQFRAASTSPAQAKA